MGTTRAPERKWLAHDSRNHALILQASLHSVNASPSERPQPNPAALE